MKLFKKVLSAVLAGVMVLSMAACAPAATGNETEIKVDPTASVPDQIIEYINKYSVAMVTNGTYKNSVQFQNDSELASRAQAILDIIAAGELDQFGNSVKLSREQYYELLDKLSMIDLFTARISSGESGVTGLSSMISYNGGQFRLSDIEYKKDKVEKSIRGESGLYATALVSVESGNTPNKVAANVKIGIASKEIHGKTVVMIVASPIIY